MITLSSSHCQGEREPPSHCHSSASTKVAPISAQQHLKGLSYLVFRWTEIQILECGSNILRESWPKDILVGSELVPGLPHDGVDDVQARDFVLRLALQTAQRSPVRQGEQPLRASLQTCSGAETLLCSPAPALPAQASRNTHPLETTIVLVTIPFNFSTSRCLPSCHVGKVGNLTIYCFPPLLNVLWKTTMWNSHRQSHT